MEPELAEVVAVRGGRWCHNGPLTGTTFIVQTTVVFDYLHKPPFIQTVSQDRPIGKTRPLYWATQNVQNDNDNNYIARKNPKFVWICFEIASISKAVLLSSLSSKDVFLVAVEEAIRSKHLLLMFQLVCG